MNDEPKTERIITPMSPHLLAQIDDFWHARHLPSRAAAIRELLEAALAAQKPAKRSYDQADAEAVVARLRDTLMTMTDDTAAQKPAKIRKASS